MRKAAMPLKKIKVKKTVQKQEPIITSKIKDLIDKANKHSYVRTLLNPFENEKGKIPCSGRFGPTFSFKKTYLTSFTCNANGDAFVYFSPASVAHTATTNSSLLIDNQVGYDPTTGVSLAIAPLATAAQLGWSNTDVKSVQIVGSGLRMYFENASTTLQPKGRVYCMRESENINNSMVTGTPVNAQQAEHPLSVIIANKEHREFKNDNYSAIEYVYRPTDTYSYEMCYGPSSILTYPANARITDEFVAILTNFESTTKVYIEIHNIYEVTIQPEGNYRGFNEYNYCIADPKKLVAALSSELDLWIRQVPLKEREHSHIFNTATKIVKASGIKPAEYDMTQELPTRVNYLSGKRYQIA